MLTSIKLIEADPFSDNVDYLSTLVKTLRPPEPDDHLTATQNVRALLDLLRNDPASASALRHYLLHLYASRRQTSLYTDIGILPNAGFFTELFQRMSYRVLPPALDEAYLRDCLDRVLPAETDYRWINAIPTEDWLGLIEILYDAAPNTADNINHGIVDLASTKADSATAKEAPQVTNVVRDLRDRRKTITELLEAMQTLSYRISAMGLEPSLIRLYPEMEDMESPFLMQNVEFHRYLAGYRRYLEGEVTIANVNGATAEYGNDAQSKADTTPTRQQSAAALIQDAKHLQVMLDQCSDVVIKIRKNALKKGTSVALTYLVVRLDQSIIRLRKLLMLADVEDVVIASENGQKIDQEAEAPSTCSNTEKLTANVPSNLSVSPEQIAKRNAAITLARELIEAHNRKYAIRELFASNINLLARNITENASRTGEHYIAESRSEFSAMFRSAAGAGVIIGFMAMMKILYSYLRAAPLVEAFLFSMNYSTGFMLIHVLHFTVATKQPAMTASRIAAGLHSKDNRNIDIDSLVDLIVKVFRTQFIAVTGNLVVVFPVAYVIGVTWLHMFGHHLVTPDKAQHLLHDLDPLHSLALFHAAIAGGCLFIAGLISGYYDNSALYTHMAKRIERVRWLRKLIGQERLQKVAEYLESNLGGLMGNFYFGILLGTIGTVGFMVGLPIDIRHITFSAANFAIALVGLDNNMGWQTAVRSVLGILAIGTINLWVSFSLALFVALRSRQVHFRQGLPLAKAILSRFCRRPIDFFIPHKDVAPEAESNSVA
ncbi:site-specific recombinase [Glaciimonas immobilis]|uniref:Site-specific recombinase n=1 Tax=Glaciimonas immobilis TaxID=728004 RepID=A0A840RQQ2_9BURK|nr:site-specific recombinase [Glaciimonas immobilis]KAF3999426.1 site-specific recombinase [Glaciimonas immobilis]MBB5198930.1 site-specific recombinase [Glaciimonas immobilis]